ncbi:MAG: group II intron reverse transcriptase/maturase [bacterium]|nr:group II intron reverse transcriptase/maturase [bacterium]
MPDPQTSVPISTKQSRIATRAKRSPGTAFRSLFHHVDLAWMREAYRQTRKSGAVGVDGQTAASYAEDLDVNLTTLLNRAKAGTYRAPPVRRVHVPKGDGSQTRPIGIPTFEDKVLQRAVVMLLEPIYEGDFYDLSYGFRPDRGAHDALGAVNRAMWSLKGGWVVDLDIQGFFDTLDHKQLGQMLRERVVDGVVTRLVGKWLRAGVLEDGRVTRSSVGTPQGGVVSPLLANLYLHVVLDRWWSTVVMPRLRGRAALVRYADDVVIVLTRRYDADRVMEVLPKRLGRFGLTLHPEKTKLVRYKRPTRGGLRSETFTFLGFTHYWAMSRRGFWISKTKTASSRLTRTVKTFRAWLRRYRHLPMKVQRHLLSRKLTGVYQYWRVPGNSRACWLLLDQVKSEWKKWLGRRSQRRLRWDVFARAYARYPLPKPPQMMRRLPGR